jgi:tryptophan synthase alpha chain
MAARENRIDNKLAQAAGKGRKSLVLFLTAGYPDLAATENIIHALDKAGTDILELGVPFSDPVADGPTIQAASFEALKTGTTLAKILELVARVRRRSEMPILLFGAYNPFLKYGLEKLARKAVEVGVDGFLVPDLPLEESEEFDAICRREGLSLVYLVAPTTPPERAAQIAERATGFVYFVSSKGVTGNSLEIDEELRERTLALRKAAKSKPIAVGFGIRTPEQVRQVAELCDAVVVGSQLIRVVEENRNADMAEAAYQYALSLKNALK